MAQSTLADIQQKVRRLTRTPSTAQLQNNDLNNYINTFVLYDFPEHLRLFSLRTTLTFYAKPYQDVYVTDQTLAVTDPLYDFKNRYITVHPPVYIAGYNSMFSQSREQFFGVYPLTNSIASIGTAGDGVTTFYTGTLQNIPVLTNNVLFSSVNANNEGLALVDIPNDPFDGSGILVVPNVNVSVGTINYVTGVFSFTFPSAPADGEAINSQTIPYVASLPQALLYYDDKFTLRPVPDQPYRIDFECYKRPVELLTSGESPELNQWWQYIAYGAAKKIFEDRMDSESVAQIMPEFKKQEALVLRRTIVQYTNDRAATIYTEQSSFGPGNGSWGVGGGGPF